MTGNVLRDVRTLNLNNTIGWIFWFYSFVGWRDLISQSIKPVDGDASNWDWFWPIPTITLLFTILPITASLLDCVLGVPAGRNYLVLASTIRVSLSYFPDLLSHLVHGGMSQIKSHPNPPVYLQAILEFPGGLWDNSLFVHSALVSTWPTPRLSLMG